MIPLSKYQDNPAPASAKTEASPSRSIVRNSCRIEGLASIMKKQILYQTSILLILLFSTSLLNAQKSEIDRTTKAYSYITFNLLSSVNPFNPRYRIGYIQNINSKWKLGLDLGFGTRKLSWSTSGFITNYLTSFGGAIADDYQLWEIRPELYYILNPKKSTIQYISTELFYIHHKDVYHRDHIEQKNGESFYFERANFLRQKYGLNIKYGFIIKPWKGLGLNLYTGLGLRFRNNSFSNVINPIPWHDPREVAVDYNEHEGLFFGFNFSVGFRLYSY